MLNPTQATTAQRIAFPPACGLRSADLALEQEPLDPVLQPDAHVLADLEQEPHLRGPRGFPISALAERSGPSRSGAAAATTTAWWTRSSSQIGPPSRPPSTTTRLSTGTFTQTAASGSPSASRRRAISRPKPNEYSPRHSQVSRPRFSRG